MSFAYFIISCNILCGLPWLAIGINCYKDEPIRRAALRIRSHSLLFAEQWHHCYAN